MARRPRSARGSGGCARSPVGSRRGRRRRSARRSCSASRRGGPPAPCRAIVRPQPGLADEVRVERAALGGDALDERDVLAVDRVRAEAVLERVERGAVAREDERARGVLVEAVDDARVAAGRRSGAGGSAGRALQSVSFSRASVGTVRSPAGLSTIEDVVVLVQDRAGASARGAAAGRSAWNWSRASGGHVLARLVARPRRRRRRAPSAPPRGRRAARARTSARRPGRASWSGLRARRNRRADLHEELRVADAGARPRRRARTPRSDDTARGRPRRARPGSPARRRGRPRRPRARWRRRARRADRVSRTRDRARFALRVEVPRKELLEPERIAQAEDVVEEPGLRKARRACASAGRRRSVGERLRRGAARPGPAAAARRPASRRAPTAGRDRGRPSPRDRNARKTASAAAARRGSAAPERGRRAVGDAEEPGRGDDDRQRQKEGVVGADVAGGEEHAGAEERRHPEHRVGHAGERAARRAPAQDGRAAAGRAAMASQAGITRTRGGTRERLLGERGRRPKDGRPPRASARSRALRRRRARRAAPAAAGASRSSEPRRAGTAPRARARRGQQRARPVASPTRSSPA